MDGVLEGAVVLCACKLACSLLFLPSLAASYSPISFCCCCLLIFTDFLVTVFLTFLCIFESWLTELTSLGDVIALRFLLFLSHTYGAVLLLTTPLIAVETLFRLLLPRRTVGSDGKVNVEEEDTNNSDEDGRLSHVVGYLCCLSVWVIVAVNVRWRWKLEEVWAVACVHATDSLVSCLPNLFSPMPIAVSPCWAMAFLFLLLILLTSSSTGLHRRHQGERTHKEKRGVDNKDDCSLIPASSAPFKPVNPGTSSLQPAQCVDPEKTESSCTVHRAYSWNSVQMSARHHGDFVLTSPGCLSGPRGGQEQGRTKRGAPMTFITEEHVDSQHRSRCGWRWWGFPCLGVNIMIGIVSVLSIFVLPLNLSVNILLIRTTEALLELFIRSLVSSAASTRDTSASHNETLV
ncbi:uncharacterized protein LOC111588029 [Amphiprion ocellaris]|uniref:uncharacterized protein LOC111588029 n=1 Tax=Amphiprion ocellaris TaxID=80972 RepID=UPI00241162F1|nr:uncharacterized protein LOC111588029 [Amphiprion ocellaris]XP_035798746.2 uncharacterized protein LOC111588029 [Amphiprion ocellaris]